MSAKYYFTDLWPYVCEHLSDIEESARRCSAILRCRNMGPVELLRVALAYAVSDMSLKDIAAWASALEITRISGPGLHYRIRRSEAWFQSLLIQVLETTETTPGTGLVVRIMDATVIIGPGSQGISWRAHVSLDPDTGRIQSVEITDTKGGESFCRYTASPNILDVGDRGYCAARGIYSRVSGGGHVLVRVNHHSIKICDLNKQKISLVSYFQSIDEGQTKEWNLLIPVPADHVKKILEREKGKSMGERAYYRLPKKRPSTFTFHGLSGGKAFCSAGQETISCAVANRTGIQASEITVGFGRVTHKEWTNSKKLDSAKILSSSSCPKNAQSK